jgi:hypothetical protein
MKNQRQVADIALLMPQRSVTIEIGWLEGA